jgi:CBS domain-containing protein
MSMSSLVHLGRAAAARVELASIAPAVAAKGNVVDEPTPGSARTARDVMTRAPETVRSSDSLWTAWDRLHRSAGQHVVVIDDHRRVLGVLDDRTLALEWPSGPVAAQRTPVHMLLRHRGRPRVGSDADLVAVAGIMLDARVDAVPVVDEAGRLFGLVTLWHCAEIIAGRHDRRGDLPVGSGAARVRSADVRKQG